MEYLFGISLLLLGLSVIGFLVYYGNNETRYKKQRIKEILLKYIKNEKRIDEFIKMIEFDQTDSVLNYEYNKKIKVMILNYDIDEKYLIESFYDYLSEFINEKEIDYMVQQRIINKEINYVYNTVNLLLLEKIIKEEERKSYLYKMLGASFYKHCSDKFVKDLFYLK